MHDEPTPAPARSVIFDTNAVHALGRLHDGEWRDLHGRWQQSGLQSGWVPHVLGEVMGTNMDYEKFDKTALRNLQRSARRMNWLCRRKVLHDVDEIVWRAIHDLAGVEAPLSRIPDIRESRSRCLDTFLTVNDPSKIGFKSRGAWTYVEITGNDGKVVVVTHRKRFVSHAQEKRDDMRERLDHSAPVPAETVRHETMQDLAYWILDAADRHGIPKDVAEAAILNEDPDRTLRNAFVTRVACENRFYHDLSTGLLGKIEENDAPDIALSTYLTPGTIFVVHDRRLEGLLSRAFGAWIFTAGLVMRFEAFADSL